jgi:hypothetical protein
MLELVDRPTAYDDVGHLSKWGMVIHELKSYGLEMDMLGSRRLAWEPTTIDEFVTDRHRALEIHRSEMESVNKGRLRSKSLDEAVTRQKRSISLLEEPEPRPIAGVEPPARVRSRAALSRRKSDTPGKLVPPRGNEYLNRRGTSLLSRKPARERRSTERRKSSYSAPFPDRRLTRSAYEQVFLKLVSGSRLRVGKDLYTPVGMKGWYHAVFRRESDGRERLLSIDQLLKKMNDWV